MSLSLTVRASVVIYGSHQDPDKMVPNFRFEKDIEIPYPFVPTELDLVIGSYPVLLVVNGVRFEEKTQKIIVFAKLNCWHDLSFKETISAIKNGKDGWRESKNSDNLEVKDAL